MFFVADLAYESCLQSHHGVCIIWHQKKECKLSKHVPLHSNLDIEGLADPQVQIPLPCILLFVDVNFLSQKGDTEAVDITCEGRPTRGSSFTYLW